MVQYGGRNILLVPFVRVLRLAEKKKKRKKTKHGKSQGRSLGVGASSLRSKVRYMLCSVSVQE